MIRCEFGVLCNNKATYMLKYKVISLDEHFIRKFCKPHFDFLISVVKGDKNIIVEKAGILTEKEHVVFT